MRRAGPVLLALACAACAADDAPPLGGGGGGTGGGGGPIDAGAQADGGGRLAGTLCAAIDLRDPFGCAAIDLAGVPVAPAGGGPGTTADADGDFTLDLPADASVLLRIGGGDDAIRDALAATGEWTGEEGLVIPAVRQEDWDDLLAILGAVEPDGTASVLLYIVDDSGPVTGAEVQPPMGTQQPPYYDAGGATSWDQQGLTGPFGAALIVSVPALAPTAELSIIVGGTPFFGSVQVRPDHLTFARAFLDDAR